MYLRQLMISALLLAGAACDPPRSSPGEVRDTHAGLTSRNALVSNALVSNALVSNALVSNALRPDGLTEGELARQFLSYLYSCAMPPEASLALRLDGNDYGTLRGGVGIAPEWGQTGGRCDERCQRLITGCMLARTNFWGVPVEISLRGPSPALIPGEAEKAEFPLREGAYFGNLFSNEGTEHLFACAGPGSNLPQLTRRFCSGAGGVCAIRVLYDCVNPGPPLRRPPVLLSSARFACERQDPDDGAVLDCHTGGISVYGDDPRGKRFRDVVTVYLREPVTVCGDGICAARETPSSCSLDCSDGWARAVGGLRNFPAALGVFPDGDLLVGVATSDTTDLGGGAVKILPGEESLLVGRLAADGRGHRWSRQLTVSRVFTSSSAPAQLDRAGNLYTLIGHSEDLWLGRSRLLNLPGPVAGLPAANALLVKLSPSGEILWNRRWLGEPFAMILDVDDTPVVGVAVGDVEHGFDRRMEVIDPEGGATVRTFSLPVDSFVTPVVVDGANRVLLADAGQPTGRWLDLATGESRPAELPEAGAAVVGPGQRTPDGGTAVGFAASELDGSQRVSLLRFDLDGHLLWQKDLASAASAAPLQATLQAIAVSPAGDIAVAGQFTSPLDLENDVFVPVGYLPGRGDVSDLWLARYDASGRKLWVRQLGGGGSDSVGAVAFDAADRIVFTGAFSQTGVFDGRILDNPFGGGETTSFETFVVSRAGR